MGSKELNLELQKEIKVINKFFISDLSMLAK